MGSFLDLPEGHILQRLYERNEYLIESNHPLKETIILKTGKNPQQRENFLNTIFVVTKRAKRHPKFKFDIGF